MLLIEKYLIQDIISSGTYLMISLSDQADFLNNNSGK